MALAEARAAWQRTANRCLVQEDAKRAPKLACCSSLPPSVKEIETGPIDASGAQDIPSSDYPPFNRNPSLSNLSPNSRWWLHMQPNYRYHKCLMDDQITSLDGKKVDVAKSEVDYGLIDRTSHSKHPFSNQITRGNKDFIVKEENFRSLDNVNSQDPVKIEAEEYFDDHYFDSESSWIGAEKNTPWWRTADTEELASLVAQRSCDLIDNCDLPTPQNTHVKKDRSMNMHCFTHHEISASLAVQKPGIGSMAARNSCRKLSVSAEDQLVQGVGKPLRNKPTLERKPEKHHAIEDDDDASKAKLLEALRHSQTRAREAEKVAKQACAEKEHVVKLVFRQASQLFAYKQWLQLLQLENMYFQFKENQRQSAPSSNVFSLTLPGSSSVRTRKMRKGWQKTSTRKRAKRSRPWYDVGKYAVVFALGLGLVGAGLLLGWTIGWMLPTWW